MLKNDTNHETATRLDQNFLKTLTLLYVEDDADTRNLFSDFLRRPVGTLITACNGAEGLQAFFKHAPDIVLTDIHMPIMDGLTMAAEIRNVTPSVPIIVVTAFEMPDYLKRAELIGVDKYVTKPVNGSRLQECLLECAQRLHAKEQIHCEQHLSGDNQDLNSAAARRRIAESAKKNIRILLVEDNIINQKVAQSILNKLGYTTDVVANGLEALRALELTAYDLVLMDCQMPEMDGFTATARIRDAGSKVLNHAVPIIAMTSSSMNDCRKEHLKSGMDDYLSKPVKKDELYDIITKWLLKSKKP